MRRRSRLGVFGDARLRNTTLAVLVVILVVGLAFGLPAVLVAVLALTCLAIAAVVRVLPGFELVWPTRRDESTSSSWTGVAMVSHGIAVANSSPWEFDRVIRPRLTRLATAALTHHGMAWDTEAARAALGPEVHDALRPPIEGAPDTLRMADDYAVPDVADGADQTAPRALPDGQDGPQDRDGPGDQPGPSTSGGLSRTELARAALDALDRLEAGDRMTLA